MSMTPEQIKLTDAVGALLSLNPAPGFEGNWSRVFCLQGGGRLYFSTGRQRGQLHVSASVAEGLREHRPYYRDGEAPKTSINVSDSKDARRIAADVQRRLLPEHEREAADCTARRAQRNEHNAKRIEALTQVAAPFGERVDNDERSGEPHPLCVEREGKFRLTAKPFLDSIKLEIEVSPAVAGRIAAMLAVL